MSRLFEIKTLQEQAIRFLHTHLDKSFYYHNAEHTRNVCLAIEEFTAADASWAADQLEALQLAAVFHDFGYLAANADNEALALPYIRQWGTKFQFSDDLIMQAHELIMETCYPYHPVTPAGKLLCDADIEYIGRADFAAQADLFRQELAAQGVVYSELQWWQLELQFLLDNHFFTEVCRARRGEGRLANIAWVRRQLQRLTGDENK